jgi:2-methylcitrate dehydratase PrpD
MSLTESLAEFACEASLTDLSPEAIDATKRVTLDTIGCAVGGRGVISSQAVTAVKV